MDANTYPPPKKSRKSWYRANALVVRNRDATYATIPRATTATRYAFPNERRARPNSLMVLRSDHDRVAAPHIRFGQSKLFHDLGDDAVQQEDRDVLEEGPERCETSLSPDAVRSDE